MTIPEGQPVVISTPPAPSAPSDGATPPVETVTAAEYQKVLEEKDRLFARAKRAEEDLKEVRGTTPPPAPSPTPAPKLDAANPFELAKAVAALKDYDQAEIDFASTIAKAKNIQPGEAVQSQEFKFWLKGKREEDLRTKQTPSPTNPSSPQSLPERDKIGAMSTSEFQKLERDHLEKRVRGGF